MDYAIKISGSRILLAILLLPLLALLASKIYVTWNMDKDFGSINFGMRIEDVEAILGKPSREETVKRHKEDLKRIGGFTERGISAVWFLRNGPSDEDKLIYYERAYGKFVLILLVSKDGIVLDKEIETG